MVTNIMLIDDKSINLFIAQKIIKRSTQKTIIKSFESGIDALDFLKNLDKPTTTEDRFIPHIILLDINMPIMDGFQFLNEFDKIKNDDVKQICVYILSSSINPQEIKKASCEKCCKGFISKPLTVEKVDEVLKNYRPYLQQYDYLDKDINLDILQDSSFQNFR